MTEEENKAIEYFKDDINYLEEELKGQNFLGRFITIRDKECKMLKILLNLIEKLQEENEELHKEIERQGNAREIEEEYIEKKFVSKDKIREKIKELEEYIVKIEEETCGRCITIGEDMCIRYLKELLEEE